MTVSKYLTAAAKACELPITLRWRPGRPRGNGRFVMFLDDPLYAITETPVKARAAYLSLRQSLLAAEFEEVLR